MIFSEILILAPNGEMLLKKTYRPDVAADSSSIFSKELAKGIHEPMLCVQGITFLHIRRQKCYFVAVCSGDVCQLAGIETLSRIYQLCKDFCGTVNENTIKLNYILIQEILDEVIDNGYIQCMSTDKLKPFINSVPVFAKSPENRVPGLFGIEHKPTSVLDKPFVRSDNEQRRNEIYVDVIERITAIFEKDHVVSRCVKGQVKMKSLLVSGTQVVMYLNNIEMVKNTSDTKGYGNSIYLEDCKLHSSAKYEHKEKDRVKTITVSPQQGEICVMSYSINDNLVNGCPFKLKSYCQPHSNSKDLDFGVKLSCDILPSCQALNVTLRTPVPKSTRSVSEQLGGEGQTGQLEEKEKVLVWNIKKLSGKSEATAHFQLIEGNKEKSSLSQLGPAILDFEIAGHLSSNMQIRQLQLVDCDKSCPTHRWIRYITTPETYMFKVT